MFHAEIFLMAVPTWRSPAATYRNIGIAPLLLR